MAAQRASVWSYCRFADFLTWLGRCLLLTPALHFVDDIETDDLAPSSSESVQELGKHLAARFKERKAKPPAPQHQLLGVTLRLEESRAVIECTAEARQRMDTLLCKSSSRTSSRQGRHRRWQASFSSSLGPCSASRLQLLLGPFTLVHRHFTSQLRKGIGIWGRR